MVPLSDIEMKSICRQFRLELDCEEKEKLANLMVKREHAFLERNRRTRHAIPDFVALLGTPDVYGDGFCDYFISTNECPWVALSFRSLHYRPMVDEIDIVKVCP